MSSVDSHEQTPPQESSSQEAPPTVVDNIQLERVPSMEAERAEAQAKADGQVPGTGFWNVAHSIGAGLLGVQSRKNRERDFTQGKLIHFVIGGVIGTLLFLIAIWLFVQFLIATS